ncbi:MAG: hypothetical protein WBJ13_11040 [Sedimentibacter sp.]
MNIELNSDFTLNLLEEIINIPSPPGFYKQVMEYVEKFSLDSGYKFEKNKKGNGIIEIEGTDNS